MTIQEFVSRLEPHADEPLTFTTERAPVPGGYHVTEIKTATIEAMDCGGVATAWAEAILQVSPPARAAEERPMSVAKFLGIYRRVAQSLPVPEEAQVRVEYGAAGEAAVSHVVAGVDATSRGIEVQLTAPRVACKGSNRAVGHIPTTASIALAQGQASASCCAPAGAASARGATAAVCCG